tara:strand:- start:636 stop:1352 length:717 start_codon:yes stop_codon:yes gene_type:complete
MEEQYISENIVIKKGFSYYKDKLIKKHNWHLLLVDLGWEKLHKVWITKLNTFHNPYPNNSLFGALECGDDGDCLFHCIAYALNTIYSNTTIYDSSEIRTLVANSITHDIFNNIITCYRSMKDIDDFDESWDPYEIDTLDSFKEQVKKSGNSYWGDHLLLQLLIQVCNINIFILTQNEFTQTYEPYSLLQNYDKTKGTIVLLHENNMHFKLVGNFKNYMIVYFTNESLPLEIKRLFKLK